MNGPNTDHGSGEGITVKGQVRRASEIADDSFVNTLNTGELAVNLADALKEAGWAAAKHDAAQKTYKETRVHHARCVRHCERLQERLDVALGKVRR